jgi:acyl-CoA reductase-like NAD-dependent aldehyde dehydrogenase
VNAINTVPALAQKAVLDPRIKMLSFTGSPQVGWMLKGLVPQKRVTLELGGDATAILTPTTNLAHAAKSLATAAFAYAGQICISLQHILCHSSIYDRFKAQFLAEVERIPYGNPADRATICGPLISDEAADHIMTIIAEAELAGASILAGGNRLARVIQPTVLENVSRSVTLGCQEAFGPVVTLQPYDNLAEAIDWVNVSQYGIHASIYTQDQDEHQRAFAELETGGLIVNDAPTLRFDAMPYGGVKQSGFGREGIENTMLEMTEDKTIAIRRLVD